MNKREVFFSDIFGTQYKASLDTDDLFYKATDGLFYKADGKWYPSCFGTVGCLEIRSKMAGSGKYINLLFQSFLEARDKIVKPHAVEVF